MLKRFYIAKLVLVLLLAAFFARYFFIRDKIISSFLHGFLLVVHEAGHMLMQPFGEFFTILGGTLWQILLPVIIMVYFFISRQFYSGALVLFLVGFSLVDASVYVGDARLRQLPLITFDKSTHDWWNLLLSLELLRYDKVLAGLFYLQGWVCFFLASYLGIVFSQKQEKKSYMVA